MANVRSLEAAQFIDRLADNRDKKGWFNNNNNKEGKKKTVLGQNQRASMGWKNLTALVAVTERKKPQPHGWCCPTCWARSYQIPNDFETDSKDWKLSLT